MNWLAKNFPALARLATVIKVSQARTQPAPPVEMADDEQTKSEAPVEGPVDQPTEESTEEPTEESTASKTPSTSIAQMYNTWVGLEETISVAQAEMQSVLAKRRDSESMRNEAQKALEQADSAWEEAGRLTEAAKRAFERGFSFNLPALAARLRTIKEVDEARRAQAQLRRASNAELWEEADRARQKATAELLKALTSIASAVTQVSRELTETGNLPIMAESLRNSALEDLHCAQAIGDELALLGREALEQLESEQISGHASLENRLAFEPATSESISGDFDAQQETPAQAQETPHVPDEPGPRGVSETVESAGATARIDDPTEVVEIIESAPISAAEQLRREFEAASGPPTSLVDELERGLQSSGPPRPGAELSEDVLGSLAPPDAVIAASAAGDNQGSPQDLAPHSEVEGDASHPSGATATEPMKPLPESYSGRVYLMFSAALDQDALGTVWEALDEVAGSGAIVDNRLVSEEAGIQFTLELGNKVLSVDRLRNRMAGAAFVALAEDRLKVDWPRQA